MSYTVKNIGQATAGPFSVSRTGASTFSFPALAAGASVTHAAAVAPCVPFPHTAVVDSTSQVAESDEANNSVTLPPPIC